MIFFKRLCFCCLALAFPFWGTYCQMQDDRIVVEPAETTVATTEVTVTTETTSETDICETVEMTVTTLTTTELTETTATTVTTEAATTETATETTASTSSEPPESNERIFLGTYKATYYNGSCYPCNGGSGRVLNSCYVKDDEYKGSVASRLVYESYGYFKDGVTSVYIEFPAFPKLNGLYSVDDCNAESGIFDFYFAEYGDCPWKYDGVTVCKVWI